MHSVGYTLKDIDVSQFTYYFNKSVASYLETRSDIDFIVFQQSLIRPPIRPPFAILHERESWSYQGIIITHSLELAKNLYATPQPKRKVFYAVNLDWLGDFDYDYNKKIYSEFDLIAENNSIYNILKNHWTTPIATVENFNIGEILKVLGV